MLLYLRMNELCSGAPAGARHACTYVASEIHMHLSGKANRTRSTPSCHMYWSIHMQWQTDDKDRTDTARTKCTRSRAVDRACVEPAYTLHMMNSAVKHMNRGDAWLVDRDVFGHAVFNFSACCYSSIPPPYSSSVCLLPAAVCVHVRVVSQLWTDQSSHQMNILKHARTIRSFS